jgi:hypothetical protein
VKSEKSESQHYVAMGRRHWDVPLQVERRNYKRFARRLDRQLRKLVERWADTAAPAAIRAGRRSR